MPKTAPSVLGKYKQLRADLDAYIEAANAQIAEEARNVIATVARDFLTRNPTAHAIRWTQYTPYWSDGDACVFHRNGIELQLSSLVEGESEDEDGAPYFSHHRLLKQRSFFQDQIEVAKARIPMGWESVQTLRGVSLRSGQGAIFTAEAEIARINELIAKAGGEELYAALIADFEDSVNIIRLINDSDFEIAFGDHVEVVVTRDGISVSKYQHD
jgi:hypothetical protein